MHAQEKEKMVNRTVLAITDFSKKSTNAILFAITLFKYTNLKLILLNVFENPGNKTSMLISVEDILFNNSETSLEKQVADIKSVLKEKKLDIVTRSVAGKLKNAINTVIQSENIDLIAIGISPDKFPSVSLNNIPILFMGQNRCPMLVVPEDCSGKPVKNALVLNLESSRDNTNVKGLEHLINHDHISKHVMNLDKNKANATALLVNRLAKQKEDIIIIIPSPGDKIDRALLQYQVGELYPSVASLLGYNDGDIL